MTASASEKPLRVFIVHGYTAAPDRHWFPWLKAEMESRHDAAVHIPAMPDPDTPCPKAWQKHLQDVIGTADAHTYLIGHSLGSVAVLRYAAGLAADVTLGGVILVAGFNAPLPTLPALDGFMAEPAHTDAVIARSPKRAVIHSDNDAIVPPAFTADLAAALDVAADVVPNGGHFLGDEGFREFPLVYEKLQRFMQGGT
jgi:predicted alpha/beta hydrolase family esterase